MEKDWKTTTMSMLDLKQTKAYRRDFLSLHIKNIRIYTSLVFDSKQSQNQ